MFDGSSPKYDVQLCRVSDIISAPEFPALVAECAEECKIDGLPEPDVRISTYSTMEATGYLTAFGAYDGLRLVGFLFVLAAPMPHYAAIVAVCESFFVGKADRAGGPGRRLLVCGEEVAREKGSPGLLVSAPVESQIARLLPRAGYEPTSTVYFKRFT